MTKGVKLSVKIGIGFGETKVVFVGGELGRYEYVVTGTPLQQAFEAENAAVAGQVIISNQARSVVEKGLFEMKKIDSDNWLVTAQTKRLKAQRFADQFSGGSVFFVLFCFVLCHCFMRFACFEEAKFISCYCRVPTYKTISFAFWGFLVSAWIHNN